MPSLLEESHKRQINPTLRRETAVPNIVRQAPTALTGGRTRLPNKVARQVEGAGHRGLVAAANVQAAAYATHVAMNLVTMLSAEEGQMIEMCPLAEPRLKVLVDSFSLGAAKEIQGMSW